VGGAGVDYVPMMIAMEPAYEELVRWSAERFERLNGKKVKVLGVEDIKAMGGWGAAPSECKLWLWEAVPKDVDWIMCLDYDLVPFRALPPIEPEDAAFMAVPMPVPAFEVLARQHITIARNGYAFNSGFWLAHRSTQPTFDVMKLLARRQQHREAEETWMNCLIPPLHKVKLLPAGYNWHVVSTSWDIDAEDIYIMHHTSGFADEQDKWRWMYLMKQILGDGSEL